MYAVGGDGTINEAANGFLEESVGILISQRSFLAAPNVDMSDGLLDVVIMKDSGGLKMLDELVNLKSGDHFDDDNIMYAQAETVSIKSKERDVTVTLDGEPPGILPAVLHVFPKALNVII